MVDVEVRMARDRTVYAMKLIGPYMGIGEAFTNLSKIVHRQGHHPTGVVGVFLDNPAKVPGNELVSYACIETQEPPTQEGAAERRTIPGGLVARITAKGPYGGPSVQEAYRALYAWIRASGSYEALALADRNPFESTCREFYANDPATVPPSDWITEIEVPVREK